MICLAHKSILFPFIKNLEKGYVAIVMIDCSRVEPQAPNRWDWKD